MCLFYEVLPETTCPNSSTSSSLQTADKASTSLRICALLYSVSIICSVPNVTVSVWGAKIMADCKSRTWEHSFANTGYLGAPPCRRSTWGTPFAHTKCLVLSSLPSTWCLPFTKILGIHFPTPVPWNHLTNSQRNVCQTLANTKLISPLRCSCERQKSFYAYPTDAHTPMDTHARAWGRPAFVSELYLFPVLLV